MPESPTYIRSKQKFFINMKVPKEIIRDEQVRIPLSVYSDFEKCLSVKVTVRIPKGVDFLQPGHSTLTRSLCVEPNEIQMTSIFLNFKHLGKSAILAEAKAFDSACCENAKNGSNFTKNSKNLEKSSKFNTKSSQKLKHVAVDAIRKQVLVSPEGEERSYDHTVFFCANKRIDFLVNKPGQHENFNPDILTKNLIFTVRGTNSISIVLSAFTKNIHILLGTNDNKYSSLSLDGVVLANISTPEIIDGGYQDFYLSWENGHILISKPLLGLNVTNKAEILSSKQVLMQYFYRPRNNKSFNVSTIAFGSMSNETSTSFKIQGAGITEPTPFSMTFTLNLPPSYIKNSVRSHATVVGDIMGPILSQQTSSLLKIPSGSGEHNLLDFSRNIFLLRYIKRTKQSSFNNQAKLEAEQNLVRAYQKQLLYRRTDFSYSPFGEKDSRPSIWLTASVLWNYVQASEFIFIDPLELQHTVQWLMKQQYQSSGGFKQIGKTFNQNIQSGYNVEVTVSSYVTLALAEYSRILATKTWKKSVDQRRYKELVKCVKKAGNFLEKSLENIHTYENLGDTSSYTMALLTFALTAIKSDVSIGSLEQLDKHAFYSFQGANELKYWSPNKMLNSDRVQRDAEKSSERNPFENLNLIQITNTTSEQPEIQTAEIETTAYALLSYVSHGDVGGSLPIVRWLSSKRNNLGGFSSTQDTTIALYALSKYAELTHIKES